MAVKTAAPASPVDPPDEPAIIRTLAARAASHSPDNSEAVKEVIAKIKAERNLYQQLAGELLEMAALSAVLTARAEVRQNLKRSAMAFRGLESIAAVGNARHQANLESFLTRWIVNGVPLGDCTGTDLEAAVKQENETARGHQQNAAFYKTLADRAGNRVVRAVLTDEDAARLWASIQTGAKRTKVQSRS